MSTPGTPGAPGPPQLRIAADQPRGHHPQALQVIDRAVPETLLEPAYQALRTRFMPPVGFFWVDLELVQRHAAGDPGPAAELGRYLPDEAVALILTLLQRLYFDLVPDAGRDRIAGFEVGTQLTLVPELGNVPVRLHFDCDPRRLMSGEVRGPLWSSVLHLGPTAGLVGGETAVGLELPVNEAVLGLAFRGAGTVEDALGASHDWVTVPFRRNRLIVFEGILPHFRRLVRKLPSADEPRVTMVAAAYDYKVLDADGPCPFPPRAVRILHSLRLREQLVVSDLAAQLEEHEVVDLVRAFAAVYGRLPGEPRDRRVVARRAGVEAAPDEARGAGPSSDER